MKITLLSKILKFSVFKKAITFKCGSLFLLSVPLSFSFVGVIKRIIKDVEVFDLILPILTITVCIGVYFLFFITDFFWGLIASKQESKNNPDWIESDKLYSSLGKIGGVLLIDILFLVLLLFLVVLGFVSTSIVFLIIAVMLNVLAMLYELHSIGENIKRKTGKKPQYLKFFEKITSLLEEKIMSKLNATL
ncbi:MAG: phage holin family protein [Flavobacteriaceae bacterium]|nr:phage holin family protein [Flavobacteriaceae bacterium]